MSKTHGPFTAIALCAGLVAVNPNAVDAQPRGAEPRAEVFVSVGSTGLSRFEDRGFGRHSDVGAGAALLITHGLALQIEAQHVYGLKPGPSGCEVNAPCGATAASASGRLQFGTSRVQGYVLGGIVILRTETRAFSTGVEARTIDTGVGPLIGGGVKVGIVRGLFVQPSVWAGTTVWMSHVNLSTSRASLAAGYRW